MLHLTYTLFAYYHALWSGIVRGKEARLAVNSLQKQQTGRSWRAHARELTNGNEAVARSHGAGEKQARELTQRDV
jgi:hypothetical protein